MSLSRAFTTRGRRNTKETAGSPIPQRSLTTKHAFPAGTIRHIISAPVELISTTNMLSYNAPDIFPKTSASPKSSTSSRSSNSDDDSVRSATMPESPISSPDGSLNGSTPPSPELNHLSCYFGSGSGEEGAPKIPSRALSHTKKNAEILARKRSISRTSSQKNSVSTVRSSINMFSLPSNTPEQSEQHPFGNELAKVSEIAEDYGISKERLTVVDKEEQELLSRGLFKFRAEDYMNEIQGFLQNAFSDARPTMPSSMWI
ncbi:hypothetical protein LSUB1_G003818 [Lachnellula subtilissima]|uniref:Uncharacterized protein n=1 Tax=Lachnellula subtilissima TaxID=602034 RepID=A0A8H8UBY1_9HELO|nr:hypothetical protein LSUB1_G003818 [Lachnellula subtilissima]